MKTKEIETILKLLPTNAAEDRMLQDILKRYDDMQKLLEIICKKFPRSEENVKSDSRERPLPEMREIFSKIIIENSRAKYSFHQVGNFLGRRDHSTIMYSKNECQNHLETDKIFKALFNDIRTIYLIETNEKEEILEPIDMARIMEEIGIERT
jgi:chromosomal replication initiation ATPase DnaA